MSRISRPKDEVSSRLENDTIWIQFVFSNKTEFLQIQFVFSNKTGFLQIHRHKLTHHSFSALWFRIDKGRKQAEI